MVAANQEIRRLGQGDRAPHAAADSAAADRLVRTLVDRRHAHEAAGAARHGRDVDGRIERRAVVRERACWTKY